MMLNPRVGSEVQVHYNKRAAPHMPHHGKVGTVLIASRGRPRNHLIDIDGTATVVPCGNIRKVK